jgi:hypothetical protein
MSRKWLWLLSLVLGVPGLSGAAPPTPGVQFTWTWHRPQDAPAPQWQLRLVETTGTGTTQKVVPLVPLDAAQCQALVPGGTKAPKDWCGKATCPAGTTWCGQMACPAPGAYTAALQQGDSLPTNAVSFGIAADDKGCTLTPHAQGLTRPTAPAGTPLAAGLPPDPAPTAAAPMTTRSLTEDEVETVTQEMAALDQQFAGLDTTYQAALQTITERYQQVLDEARMHSQQGAWAKAEEAWRQATQLQAQVYERTQAHFDHLHAIWHTWLTRLEQWSAGQPLPPTPATGEQDATRPPAP